MGLFRRHETLNERLLREAGLEPATVDATAAPEERERSPAADEEQPPHPFGSVFFEANSRATHARPREWDTVVTVEAPELAGDEAEFTATPDGSLIVGEDEQRDLSRLADAVERELQPPYKARAVRQARDMWAVSATRIDVLRLKAEGDAIEVAVHDGERTVTVDGAPTRRSFPELERLGEREGSDYAVRAERLDGDLWEVRVSPL